MVIRAFARSALAQSVTTTGTMVELLGLHVTPKTFARRRRSAPISRPWMALLAKTLLLFAAAAAVASTPHVPHKPQLSRPHNRPAAAQISPPSSSPISRLRGGGAVGWASVTPPIVALVASVALQQVIVALLLGIYVGCLVLSGGAPVQALLRVFDTYLIRAFNAEGHAGVLLFTFLLGGTIGLVQKAGGGLALALLLQRYMKSAKSALLSAWALCGLIFFDDYSSVLIVGVGACRVSSWRIPSSVELGESPF